MKDPEFKAFGVLFVLLALFSLASTGVIVWSLVRLVLHYT